MHSTPRYLAAATTAAFGVFVAVASAADPTIVPGNPSCADLDSSWSELKYDGGDPGQHNVSDGTVSGTITIDQNGKTATFNVTPGIDAVIVKAGNQANVYEYDPDATSGTVESGSQAQISHVSLCYGPAESTPGGNNGGGDDGGGGGDDGGQTPDGGDDGGNTTPPPGGTQQQQTQTQSGSPPDQVEVLGETVGGGAAVTGRSVLHGPSSCVTRAFTVRVTGRQIRKVTFFVDGRRVKSSGRRLRIRPARYGSGLHRVQALVRYTAASGTRARRHRLVFQRCARQSILPQFTG
jgi:hypothetical protein